MDLFLKWSAKIVVGRLTNNPVFKNLTPVSCVRAHPFLKSVPFAEDETLLLQLTFTIILHESYLLLSNNFGLSRAKRYERTVRLTFIPSRLPRRQ